MINNAYFIKCKIVDSLIQTKQCNYIHCFYFGGLKNHQYWSKYVTLKYELLIINGEGI